MHVPHARSVTRVHRGTGRYFTRAFTAPVAFLDAIKAVLHDIKFYFAFLLLVVLGFACAFQILYRRDQAEHEASWVCVCGGVSVRVRKRSHRLHPAPRPPPKAGV